MTLQQIKYVIGVASCGSFNKASEKLYISQPSLTSSVHDLEDELGFAIFKRSSRGTTVTERGVDFLNEAKELYQKYEGIVKKYSVHEKKTFSVSALYYAFARKAFIQIVKDYSGTDYDFSFGEKKASDVIDDVAEGKSDIGILYLSETNREAISKHLGSHSLQFHHLTECNAFVYLHKNHPLAKKQSLSLDELTPYRFVTFDTDDVKSFFSDDVIEKHGLDKAITVADRSTELDLLEKLNGYTFLSGVFGEDQNDPTESFVLIPLKKTDGKISHSFELGYITKIGTHMDNICLIYIDAIRRFLNIAGFTC